MYEVYDMLTCKQSGMRRDNTHVFSWGRLICRREAPHIYTCMLLLVLYSSTCLNIPPLSCHHECLTMDPCRPIQPQPESIFSTLKK